ncbi:phosphomannomutase/phosphoglucomutase [Dasania marina]|uniref:phosphomannomutase/phosphoglucomutase n=1 Tax=Dasania marina TaxID=471499 RepID=UPI0030DBEAA7|tara:strand:+ start:57054 stop:59534 length:2481 start_codon:yes stop_codon:yes gene_type:complete
MVKQKNNNNSPAAKPANAIKTNLVRCALISLLAVCGSFLYLALIEQPNSQREQLDALANRLADNQVFLLNQAIDTIQLRSHQLATNPQLLAALENGDSARLVTFQIELQRSFPLAISAKIIPLGTLGIAGLDKQQASLRNNIELDMLRRVSNDEKIVIESYRSDKLPLFSLAEAIQGKDKKHAAGALLISYNNTLLHQILSQLDSNLGQTSLVQTLASNTTLAKIGDAASNAPTVTRSTAVNHWQISFTPSAQLMANHSPASPLIWILLAICLVAILAATALTLSSLSKALADNLALLSARSKGPFSLPGFDDTAQQLLEDLKKLEAQIKRKQAASKQQNDTANINPVAAIAAELGQGDADSSSVPALPQDIPDTIFRAYDIRGIADQELTDEHCYAIGLAIGSEALDQGQQSLLVAADGRHSSPRIRDALSKGILASGCDVIDIGMVPSPLLYFATHQLDTQSGVMITGSHNPAEYNGLKIVIAGHTLSDKAISALRERIVTNKLHSGKGSYSSEVIEDEYIDYIINDVAIAQPLKIVIDAGNGVTGNIAPRLFEELGCEVIPLYCDIDGDFPNHHPDPTVAANLADLIVKVRTEGADLGIAFDGDGDRLGVVTAEGNIVPADRLLMLLAQDVVSRNPGADVIFDVKCTRSLNSLISNYGGRPIMWKTGHSFMKEKMLETGALLGGEFSGHIFFKERWFGFDDGMYAAARLIEILSTTDPDLDAQLSVFPVTVATPELKVASDEQRKFSIIEQLIQQGQFGDGKVSTLDGVRVDFNDGWGLVRASNTTPMLVLRFEANDQQTLSDIQTIFKQQLSNIDSSLQFDF